MTRTSAMIEDAPPQFGSALTGQVAVIIGGTSGIGRALSKALLRRGCRVVTASRSGGTSLRSEQEQIEARDLDHTTSAEGHLIEMKCDVSQAADVNRLFQSVVNMFESLDIVVNCAGIGRGSKSRNAVAPAMHLDECEWQEVCDTNLRGMFLVARAAARHMIGQKSGQIVNISSARSARRGQPFAAAYSATKMATLAMFQSIADELARFGIRAWSMLPDAVATDLIANTNLAKRGAMNPDHFAESLAAMLSLPADACWHDPLLAPYESNPSPL